MASEAQRKEWRAYNRRRRAAARENGTCTTCLSRPKFGGRSQCRICIERRRAR